MLELLCLNHANTDTRCTWLSVQTSSDAETHIFAQFCQVTTDFEVDMGRGQILSLVLLLFLLSFILPCQGKPRGGRGGGGRGGGRGGRGGGGWRWFGGSSYSSGSRYHTTRSSSVVTTPKPTPETILSPTGAG